MLLSRVAENLYWAARYLERAEDTARIVREHTNLIVDMPTSVLSTWAPLLAITGTAEMFVEDHRSVDEATVVQFLVSDGANHGSIRSSVEQARENLRGCRDVLPATAWLTINDLYLYVSMHHTEGVERRSRARFLDRVVAEHQRTIGILTTMMTRDEAYTMLRLGRHLERADMATRVLDVWAAALTGERPPGAELYDDLQWSSVLSSLSALQMFQRSQHESPSAANVVEFIVHTETFPRSVRYCLTNARSSLLLLPNPAPALAACDRAVAILERSRHAPIEPEAVHGLADEFQVAIGDVHGAITNTYFLAAAVPS
jgi:uncharacterized alpha-E superfamily protein